VPEPHVALATRRTQEGVAEYSLGVEHVDGAEDHLTTLDFAEITRLLELLEMERVVKVDDYRWSCVGQPRIRGEDVTAEHHDVTPSCECTQTVTVGKLPVALGAWAAAGRGRRNIDVMLSRENSPEFDGANSGAGEFRTQRFGRDDRNSAPDDLHRRQ
jgi:hypothetical protein